MMPAQPYGEPAPADPAATPAQVFADAMAAQNAPPAPEPVAAPPALQVVAVEPPAEPAAVVPPAEPPAVGELRFYTRFDPFSTPARDRTYAVLVIGVEPTGVVRGLPLGTVEDAGAFQPGELTS